MTITFDSQFVQNDEKKHINFTTELITEDVYEGAKVFEFAEPEKNILTRIEVSKTSVVILTGPSSLEMKIGQTIQNEYLTSQGNIFIDALLEKVDIKEKHYNFEYTLSMNKSEIGRFNITLTIKE